jgi:hypothetical protein
MFILDEFMKEQLLQYNIGTRHLANMMGEDPDTFTQEDVDVSTQKVTGYICICYNKVLIIVVNAHV